MGALLGKTVAGAAPTALCVLVSRFAGNGVGRVRGVAAGVGVVQRQMEESVLAPFFEALVFEILAVDIPASVREELQSTLGRHPANERWRAAVRDICDVQSLPRQGFCFG